MDARNREQTAEQIMYGRFGGQCEIERRVIGILWLVGGFKHFLFSRKKWDNPAH